MQYKINNIQEVRYESVAPSDQLSDENVILSTSHLVELSETFKYATILFHVAYGLKRGDEIFQLMHSDIAVEYLLQSETESDISAEFDDLLPHLLGITIGTVRGIIYCRTKGEQLNKFILPTLNPTQMIENKKNSQNDTTPT